MIGWFAKNHVAANLLMVGIVMAGMFVLNSGMIPLEVFPDFPDRTITVTVPYPGATPDETEELIVVKVEEAIEQVQGIEHIYSTAGSSGGTVNIEVTDHADARVVLDDIKNKVDAISTFPRDAEKPVIQLQTGFFTVITVVVSGDLSEADLAAMGAHVRDELVALPGISQADLSDVRPFEISIEVPESELERYGLSLEAVRQAIAQSSLDLPAGVVRTESGEVAIKTRGRALTGQDYAAIVVARNADGTQLTLGDVAEIHDGFNENPLLARYNGKRCVTITVTRPMEGNAVEVAEEVKRYIDGAAGRLPEGVEVAFWNDRSKIVQSRMEVMINNAIQSFLLVFVVLLLFLRLDVAVWVTMGIPVAFLGSFALMPLLGITINSSSLFGFIMVLGIVVDDAIVVGESIVQRHEAGGVTLSEAAIEGTRLVSTPVIFGVLTNVIAFTPMILGMGDWGPMFQPIALVVIPCMLFSLVESQLVLPSHLSKRLLQRPSEWVAPLQRGVNRFLTAVVRVFYRPLLVRAVRHRYISAAIFLGGLMVISGYIFGGHVVWMPFPRVPSERITARLVMLEGTPVEITHAHVDRMTQIAEDMRAEYVGEDGRPVIKQIVSLVGGTGFASSHRRGVSGQPHLGEVNIETFGPEERSLDVSTVAMAEEWRRRIGEIVGAEELTFRSEIFRGGDPIDIQLMGNNPRALLQVSDQIKERLKGFPGVFDVTDSLDEGRKEIQFELKPEAKLLGITVEDLARQVRQSFYGAEVQRLQRGRDEVRVFVRLPKAERESLATLERMRVRGPDGSEMPLAQVAQIHVGKSFSSIQRIDRQRAINIRADAEKERVDVAAIKAELADFIDHLLASRPGIRWSFEGEDKAVREAGDATFWGTLLTVLGLYAMLAIPFRSYAQPLVVMMVIPFGIVGAVVGHLLHDLPLSMLSLFGMLALAGVIINDSIVLVDFINRARQQGMTVFEAVVESGPRRFRPILLTSVTTFVGLMPLLAEKGTSSQFLIPMAVSLGYGILFGTMITLVLVPVCYSIMEDMRSALAWIWRGPAQADFVEPSQSGRMPEPVEEAGIS
ncbi:MAG: efflux RND transporter permease subunit [Verrucomicrobiales bacterium]|nr:efflux RND transporter permease subunit [Verrucomicrobiales bacterium]